MVEPTEREQVVRVVDERCECEPKPTSCIRVRSTGASCTMLVLEWAAADRNAANNFCRFVQNSCVIPFTRFTYRSATRGCADIKGAGRRQLL